MVTVPRSAATLTVLPVVGGGGGSSLKSGCVVGVGVGVGVGGGRRGQQRRERVRVGLAAAVRVGRRHAADDAPAEVSGGSACTSARSRRRPVAQPGVGERGSARPRSRLAGDGVAGLAARRDRRRRRVGRPEADRERDAGRVVVDEVGLLRRGLRAGRRSRTCPCASPASRTRNASAGAGSKPGAVTSWSVPPSVAVPVTSSRSCGAPDLSAERPAGTLGVVAVDRQRAGRAPGGHGPAGVRHGRRGRFRRHRARRRSVQREGAERSDRPAATSRLPPTLRNSFGPAPPKGRRPRRCR